MSQFPCFRNCRSPAAAHARRSPASHAGSRCAIALYCSGEPPRSHARSFRRPRDSSPSPRAHTRRRFACAGSARPFREHDSGREATRGNRMRPAFLVRTHQTRLCVRRCATLPPAHRTGTAPRARCSARASCTDSRGELAHARRRARLRCREPVLAPPGRTRIAPCRYTAPRSARTRMRG